MQNRKVVIFKSQDNITEFNHVLPGNDFESIISMDINTWDTANAILDFIYSKKYTGVLPSTPDKSIRADKLLEYSMLNDGLSIVDNILISLWK